MAQHYEEQHAEPRKERQKTDRGNNYEGSPDSYRSQGEGSAGCSENTGNNEQALKNHPKAPRIRNEPGCNAQPAVFNRQIAMYLAKHVGGWSTTRIGRFYKGRDHSTVCYALKRVAALREDDSAVDSLVASLATEIKTAMPKETGRTGALTPTLDGAKGPRFNGAFLDALADRLAMRIFDRAKGIDFSRDPSPR